MTRLAEVLRQFTSRYRAALLTQTAVLATLGLGVLGAAAWRLQLLHVPSRWSVGAPAVLAAAAVVSLGWRVRRHWLSFHQGAAYLDQRFGLQQRLVTAEEFDATAHPSPLYPLLVEDAVRRCDIMRAHLPKPLTRTGGVLALVLLLLLVWPRGGRPAMRLAQQPALPSPPSSSPNNTPQTPQPNGSSGQSRSDSQQSQGQQAPASGGGANQQPQQSGGSSGQSHDERQQGQGQQGQGQQGQGQGSPADARGAQQQHTPSGGQAEDGRQGAQGKGAAGAGRETGQRRQQSGTERGSQQGAQQGAKPGAQPNGASGRSAEGRQPGGNEPGAESSLPAPPQNVGGAQAGQSPGDQAALRGEIEQLLKEVSGELKQLQAQLDTAKSQAQPDAGPAHDGGEAGTGTDPQLYDASPSPSTLDASGAPPLAIQLQTDAGTVKTSRPGSGVGSASKTAASASPQASAEPAQLSEIPLEESSSVRQPVPPEYVGVFDRLHRQRTPPPQPSEAQ